MFRACSSHDVVLEASQVPFTENMSIISPVFFALRTTKCRQNPTHVFGSYVERSDARESVSTVPNMALISSSARAQ